MPRCKDCAVGLLGACGIDYCRQEREVLIEQIRQAAESRGHALSSFEKVKDRPIWRATCSHCGQLVAVDLDPPPGKPGVYGDAVSGICPEADPSEIKADARTSEEEVWYDELAISGK
jgi:hypothetical protein